MATSTAGCQPRLVSGAQGPSGQCATPADFTRIAHRGASAECPENTLAGFRRACQIAGLFRLSAHMEGYGVGQIDLPEGPRIQAPLAGRQPEFRVGQTAQAELDTLREDGGRDLMIVRFRPVEDRR